MKMENRVGARIEPQGVFDQAGMEDDLNSLIMTYFLQVNKQDPNRQTKKMSLLKYNFYRPII